MISSFGSHVRRNLIAYAALFFALGGTSFAAVQALPRNSVGSPQIKNRSIQRIDISRRAAASLRGQRGLRGLPGAQGPQGLQGPTGPQGPATGPAGGALTGHDPNPQIAAGAVGISKLGTIPAAQAFNSATESITSGSGTTTLTFNSENFDTAALHSTTTNTSRLTAPVAGLYQVTGQVRWSANGAGSRFLAINKSGAGWVGADWRQAAGGTFNITDQFVTALTSLTAGQYVELDAYQDSGATLTVGSGTGGPSLAMHWVGSAAAGNISSSASCSHPARPVAPSR